MPEIPTAETALEPIAIVGMACRFPEAASLAELLEVVVTGRRAFRRLPPVRLDTADYGDAALADGEPGLPGLGGPAPMAAGSARAALIEGWRFDRAAFGITQPGYRAADPAHWLALETAARALVDGGFPGGQGLTRDRTGVIIGNTLTGEVSRATAMRSRWPYFRRVLQAALAASDVPLDRHGEVISRAAAGFLGPLWEAGDVLTGSLPGAIADRICGHFGFRGGGHAVDAAHSSSLLAVTAACAALAAGDLDAAIAGGVDISLDPFEFGGLAATGALAAGEMRVFDTRPTGFWPGEGCGLVVLMRAADARAAGVPTYAQIAGWGVSSAGNPALTKPGSASLLLALRRAYQRAQIDPVDIQLIEGDGTGTASGDLAELTSLAQIRQGAPGLAAIGSVKANIGHTKAAAGSAGLLKATLAISAGVIPPATGCVRPHTLISSEEARLRAPQAPEPWPDRDRLAGVSSVGAGGTSVHLILRRARDGRRRRVPGSPGARHAAPPPAAMPTAPVPSGQAAAATASAAAQAAPAPAANPTAARPPAAAGATIPPTGAATAPAGTATAATGATTAPPAASAAGAGTASSAAGAGTALATGAPATEAFTFSAGDTATLARELGRVADLAPWLSDGEFHDLACQSGLRSPAQGQVRAGLVAGTQDQLARLAREAASLLPGLAPGALTASPGLYLADRVRGRVTVLFPGEGGSATPGPVPAADDGGAGSYDPALQPGIVAASLAGLRWLDELGVSATTGIGHGLGEITGLVWAGCLSEAGAARLAAQRAALLAAPSAASAERTAMACVDADVQRAQDLCAGTGLAICAHNGPRCHVLAGPAAVIRELTQRLADEGIPARLLDSPQGFYSPAMADRVSPMRSVLREYVFRPPARRLISTITGKDLTAADDLSSLLSTQLISPVVFAGPLTRAAAETDLLVETGPGHGLSRIATDCCDVPTVSLGAGRGDDGAVAQAAAALFAAGAVDSLRPLVAARPSRPVDIWRERVFIPSPCGAPPVRGIVTGTTPVGTGPAAAGRGSRRPAPTADRHATGPAAGQDPPGKSAAAPSQGRHSRRAQATEETASPPADATARVAPTTGKADSRTPAAGTGRAAARRKEAGHEPATPGPVPAARPSTTGPEPAAPGGTAPQPAAKTPRAGTPPPATPPPATAQPASPPGPAAPGRPATPGTGRSAADTAGAGPWVRCFTEQLRPVRPAPPQDAPGPWRVRLATALPPRSKVTGTFPNDENAATVLAIVGDPAEPGACGALLDAAREAHQTGQLVIITAVSGLAGFCGSLQAEHPDLGVTLIRVPLTAKGLQAARRFAAATPGRLREVVLDEGGRAAEPLMRLTEPTADGTFPLGPADVVLVSGVTQAGDLACATALAGRGAALAVIASPGPDDPRLAALLAELRAAGVRVGRKKADLTDPGQVAAAVRSLERGLGPVTAVVHAPAPGPVERCTRLSDAALRNYLMNQRSRLSNVLSSVAAQRLRVLVTFGRVAARYGSVGGCCEALAGGLLAEHAARLAGDRPRCMALHVDWAPWDAPPPAARDSGDAAPIPVPEAADLLLAMLTTPELTTPGRMSRVAVHGRLRPAARLSLLAGPARPTLKGRFLETIREHYPGVELVADTQISVKTDPYLADYRIDDLAVWPAAMALEAMAQAASALAGSPCRQVTGLDLRAPVLLPPGGQTVIRVCALSRGSEVEAVLRCGTSGFRLDHARAMFRPGSPEPEKAGARQREAQRAAGEVPSGGIVDGTDLYGPVYFQTGRFRRVAFLPEVGSTGCRALVRGGDSSPWFGLVPGPVDMPLILGSPGLNDATMHLLQACLPHRRLLAAGCERAVFTGQEVRGALRVQARRRTGRPASPDAGAAPGAARGQAPGPAAGLVPEQAASPTSEQTAGPAPERAASAAGPAAPAEGVWDVVALDATGQAVVRWEGLRMRDVGPMPRTEAWHPALLASSVEARAAELGIDPKLRVVISSGRAAFGPLSAPGAATPASPPPAPGTQPPPGAAPEATGREPGAGRDRGSAPKPGAGTEPGTAPGRGRRPGPAPGPGPAAASGSGAGQASPAPEPAPPGGSDLAPGRGPLEGFDLSVTGSRPVACRWETAGTPAGGQPPPDEGLLRLRDQLGEHLRESAGTRDARLRTIASCLAALGREAGSETSLAGTRDGGWVLVRSLGLAAACTVTDLSGAAGPVVIAVAARLAPGNPVSPAEPAHDWAVTANGSKP